MAYQLNYFANSFTAGKDLSAITGPVFMMFDATNRAVLCDQTHLPLGILENAPPLGDVAAVSYLGVTKVQVANTYSAGTWLRSDATGIGVTCLADSTFARAITLEDSSVAYDIVAVRLIN